MTRLRTPFRAAAVALVLPLLFQPTAARVTFSQVQLITGFTEQCTGAYGNVPLDCDITDFGGIGYAGSCSSDCESSLQTAQSILQRACAGSSAASDTLIGHIFVGTVVDFLCGDTNSAPTNTPAGTTASTGAPAEQSSNGINTQTTSTISSTTDTTSVLTTSSTSDVVSSTSSSSISSSTPSITTSSNTSRTSSRTTTSSRTSASAAADNGGSAGSGGGSPFDTFSSGAGGTLRTGRRTWLFSLFVLMMIIAFH